MDQASGKTASRWLWALFAFFTVIAVGMFALLVVSFLPPWMSSPSRRNAPGASPTCCQVSATPSQTVTSTRKPTLTRTPFQPLPTNTPTQTPSPTSTHTPTPTPSNTPTRRPTRTPTRTPKEPPLPDQARVENIHGQAMFSTLDCEARSAVDWAAFFGIAIDEREFLNALPPSDNPDTGFVGKYWDPQGALPPNSYGVYAGPVAALLRAYGVNAYDWKDLEWKTVQREVAAGRPVMVWIIGNVMKGTAQDYIAEDGQTVPVARNEHTVLVIGYDEYNVTVLDGVLVYQRSIDLFLASWGVLGNMAITASGE